MMINSIQINNYKSEIVNNCAIRFPIFNVTGQLQQIVNYKCGEFIKMGQQV